jgi:hypothetical protein
MMKGKQLLRLLATMALLVILLPPGIYAGAAQPWRQEAPLAEAAGASRPSHRPEIPRPPTSLQHPDHRFAGVEQNRTDLSARPAGSAEPGGIFLEASGWDFERPDAPQRFEDTGDHSLTLDTAGNLHLAYGGDHLYHAWYDGATWHEETVEPEWGLAPVPPWTWTVRNHLDFVDQRDRALCDRL